jgi:hypothetical protein
MTRCGVAHHVRAHRSRTQRRAQAARVRRRPSRSAIFEEYFEKRDQGGVRCLAHRDAAVVGLGDFLPAVKSCHLCDFCKNTNKQTNKHEQNSVMSARPQLGTLFRRARQAGGRGYDALDVVCSTLEMRFLNNIEHKPSEMLAARRALSEVCSLPTKYESEKNETKRMF